MGPWPSTTDALVAWWFCHVRMGPGQITGCSFMVSGTRHRWSRFWRTGVGGGDHAECSGNSNTGLGETPVEGQGVPRALIISTGAVAGWGDQASQMLATDNQEQAPGRDGCHALEPAGWGYHRFAGVSVCYWMTCACILTHSLVSRCLALQWDKIYKPTLNRM